MFHWVDPTTDSHLRVLREEAREKVKSENESRRYGALVREDRKKRVKEYNI